MIQQAMDWIDAQPVATMVMLFGFGWLLVAFLFGAITAKFWPGGECFPETDPLPWCDDCNSWHPPDNPTCKRRG